ncbi:MAG: BatA domain-containing protein [Xanthomonadales bacterium]|nr:BatA domain-containing protein [Xanthomonadales bacterium]
MGLGFLFPLGFAALAALAVPLVLHLVRRLDLVRTEFAALRWIGARTRPQRRVHIERPWLLLLRLSLLAVLALLLAGPVWQSPAARGDGGFIAVAPGVDRAAARAAAHAEEGEWHWLAPGFPAFEEPQPAASVPLASLLRELDAALSPGRPLHIIVPEEVAGLDGERPRLVREFAWSVVPGRMAGPSTGKPASLRLEVRHDADAEGALVYLQATVAAWNVQRPGCCELATASSDVPVAADATHLVWLAPISEDVGRWVERGGTALVSGVAGDEGEPLWRDAAGRPLARVIARGQGCMVALPGALEPVDLPILLDADFPQRLWRALAGSSPAPTRAVAAQAEPLQETGTRHGERRDPADARPLDAWFALLAAMLLLAERLLATRRRRGETA